jgi:aryl-phospho-beta-D-glucosidase BglC (GH1 family)
MKSVFTYFAFLLSFALSAQPAKFITVRGPNVIGTDGKAFLIRGTNLGNWLVPEGYMFRFAKTNSPRMIDEMLTELIGPDEVKVFWKKFLDNYITEPDIRYLKELGMNSIRLPFHYKLFTEEPYMGGQGVERGFELFERVLDWCRKYNLPVILDMHCAPGGQTGDNIDDSWGYPFLFENEPSRLLTITIWKNIADRYKNDPIILGYDLLNEPIAHYFDSSVLNPLLEPLYKRVVKAIREVDTNHIILLGGAQWNSNFRVFSPPFDSKLIYTFHKYWTATTQDVIQDYVDFSKKYNVPIYVGETGENTDQWVQEFRILCEKNNIGWHFWPYKKMENKRGIVDFPTPVNYQLVRDYADTTRTTFEQKRKMRPKDTEKVKHALDQFLEYCLYKNCRPNEGYIRALGLGKNRVGPN